MFQRYFFNVLACAALIVSTGIIASAQVGQLRGHVVMKSADGKSTPVAGAIIDVFRTDVSGKFETKTNKKGEFIFAGLPFIGEYIVAASAPGAQPNYAPKIKAGREVDYEILLFPDGDGRRLTYEEIKAHMATSGTPSGDKPSAEEAAKQAELIKKNKEIADANARNININEIVGRTFKAGNEALKVKNYDEAIKQYQEGLVADPEQGVLYLQVSEALRQRGVERFNATIKSTDADKNAGFDAAKQDFRQAVENAQKAVEFTRKEETRTDAPGIAAQNTRRLNALIARKEGMRLFVTKVDQTQADAGQTAYNEYIAAEPDAALKQKARMELAQVLVDAGAADKGFAEYEKVLAEKPDDPEAIYGAGLALFATGNEAKYKEAANYLQRFVDKAPDGHKDKEAAKAVLAELKNTANVVPEKTAPARRRRP
ncbi:MAG TPA: carboxypeptidase regulatory-like domain-containing protein [Pyrinomonadaceae bacterium]|nr:carboxypeptidase regulatory-like domain-containing protein [Pyrinomonadaceae bacterium]